MSGTAAKIQSAAEKLAMDAAFPICYGISGGFMVGFPDLAYGNPRPPCQGPRNDKKSGWARMQALSKCNLGVHTAYVKIFRIKLIGLLENALFIIK